MAQKLSLTVLWRFRGLSLGLSMICVNALPCWILYLWWTMMNSGIGRPGENVDKVTSESTSLHVSLHSCSLRVTSESTNFSPKQIELSAGTGWFSLHTAECGWLLTVNLRAWLGAWSQFHYARHPSTSMLSKSVSCAFASPQVLPWLPYHPLLWEDDIYLGVKQSFWENFYNHITDLPRLGLLGFTHLKLLRLERSLSLDAPLARPPKRSHGKIECIK